MASHRKNVFVIFNFNLNSPTSKLRDRRVLCLLKQKIQEIFAISRLHANAVSRPREFGRPNVMASSQSHIHHDPYNTHHPVEQDQEIHVHNSRPVDGDVEKQAPLEPPAENVSMFKSLSWLDRFLAVWILLAMIIGILLGNFVPNTGPALQKGKFVGVSIPIGE